MSRLHQAWSRIPLQGDLQLITADEVKELTGQEPRLMMKFDHSVTLPPNLRDTNRFILPLKNGLYAIIRGEGYHQPEACGPIQEYVRRSHFKLKTSEAGLSEMQHLDIAFNSGLLGHFLNDPLLYPTVRGRKRSPLFDLQVAGHQLEVTGVQVEIDGGYEGRHSLALVEAKIGECADFHLRQLYYPFRFWSQLTTKRIRPVFFTYQPETQVYRFREYCFEPPTVYQSPRLLKAAAYRIVDSPEVSFHPVVSQRQCPFPQADRLDKVAVIPFLVAEGHTTSVQLAELLEFSPRQGRYYQDACRALDLVADDGKLTQQGEHYVSCPPEERYRLLCRLVLKLPVLQEVISNLLLAESRTLQKWQVQQVVREATSLSPTTALRRTQTVWAWLTWVSLYCPALQVSESEIRLSQASASFHQLKLF